MNKDEIEAQKERTDDALAELEQLIADLEDDYERAVSAFEADRDESWHYTPGPWQAEVGRCIATPNGVVVVKPVIWGAGFDELDDNARLMAAAPELLDALIECRRCLAEWVDNGSMADEDHEALRAARMAIQKATGEV